MLKSMHLALAIWVLFLPIAEGRPREDKIIEEARERAIQNAGLYYDEIFDKNGNMREHYKDIYPLYVEKTKKELEEIRRATFKEFGKDNALSAMPRIIPQEEYEFVKKGVQQRGKALLLFLQDHYSGKKKYLEKEIIPKDVIDRIIARTGETAYYGKINPNDISFMYGPDIIRDADGVHRVLEDNTSFLGGQGDLVVSRESLYKHMPKVQEVLEREKVNDPMSYYRGLLERYKSTLKNPRDKIVIFAIPPYPDAEDYRLKKIWKEFGVEWVTPGGKKGFLINDDGVYLKSKGSRAKKVGFIIFNAEFYMSDSKFEPAMKQWLLAEARAALANKGADSKILKSIESAMTVDPKLGDVNYKNLEKIMRENNLLPAHFGKYTEPGLLDAITSGKVKTNNLPGTEFINDKEFNIYVDDLVRFYLKEEPVLKNLPSKKLYKMDATGKRVPDEKVFKELEKNPEKFVVKVVDGRGGDGVWVLPKLPKKEQNALLNKLRKDPSREVIMQEYKHPSVLGGDIVDMRVFSQIGSANGKYKDFYTPEFAFVRGVGMEGDGKVNLSAGKAHELAFFVRKQKKLRAPASTCPEEYSRFLSH